MPLSDAQQNFIRYWEAEGATSNKWFYRFPINFSKGMIFGGLIIIFFLVEAQRQRGLVSTGDLILITSGSILLAFFLAFLEGSMKWDKDEARYKGLKYLEQKENSGQMG